MSTRTFVLFFLAAVAVPLCAGPALAGDSAGGGSAPVFAGYWNSFIEHWTDVLSKQNGVVMAALLVGAVCLFIITRGKWKK